VIRNLKKLAKELAGKQRHSSSMLLLVIISLVSVVFVWAAVTEIDSVVRGSGKTVSEAQNQLVQSSEPGVIRKRYVSEGDFIKAGELLFDIDPIDAKTQLDQAEKRYSTLSVKFIRLKAEVENSTPNFPQTIIEAAPNAVSTELALYRARLDDLNTKSAILEQRRIQKLNEIQELKIQFNTASNGLHLLGVKLVRLNL
jgi:adhesin transport system membrane fusion protein